MDIYFYLTLNLLAFHTKYIEINKNNLKINSSNSGAQKKTKESIRITHLGPLVTFTIESH